MSDTMKWIAQWKSMKSLTSGWISVGEQHYISNYSFLLIVDGKTSCKINGQKVYVSYGDLLAIEENSTVEMLEEASLDLNGWHIQFEVFASLDEGQQVEKGEWRPAPGNHLTYQKKQLTGRALSNLIQYVNEMHTMGNGSSWMQKQHLLYELLYLHHQAQLEQSAEPEAGILRTIDFMQEHYEQMITRKRLAEIAGISPWHYSRKFNERYGKPPLDYLAHYRIYRAQEALVRTTATVQEIAQKTGFEDANYFSRRFKQITGVAPKRYQQTLSQRRIIALSPICAEVMIHLGIVPYAVVAIPTMLHSHQGDLFHAHNVKLLEIPQYGADMESIRTAEPELIIGNPWTEEIESKLRSISPVLTGLPMGVELVLHRLAVWLQREEQASRLERQMENEIHHAHQLLKSIIRRSSTVMLLRVEAFGYRYLGGHSHSISRLLYGQLGLALPQALEKGKAWFNLCSLDLLMQANPDYLFVEKRKMQHFSADENLKKLRESPQWNSLRAVKNNCVYEVDTTLWVDGHGITGQKKILDEIVSCLTNPDVGKHNNPD
ncbi:AraC family transcriptional regulator [Paenibacillus xylanexedens]|uniref:AraC family transcriptional regulator n=1 Tax=Paenibacillus xylanexedens TaxID=528191 RepID=UPI0011A276F8|nr:AraC family transcriptional regulator [Paenibacillus xylanexedens]